MRVEQDGTPLTRLGSKARLLARTGRAFVAVNPLLHQALN